MYVKTLELKNFRNYEHLQMEFDPRINLITGRNAQGKTNLIEAVYLISMGRSFRPGRDSEMIRFGQNEAVVKAEAVKSFMDTRINICINRKSKKSIKKDGKQLHKTSELLNNIYIVAFTPEDLRIVKDEPEKRRAFVDKELAQIQPAYYLSLSRYKKVLQQRNSILKEENICPSMLSLWDAQLVQYGAQLMQMRQIFIDQLSTFSSRIHDSITCGQESLEIQYASNVSYEKDLDRQKEILKEALEQSLDTDRRMRTTTRGPHKDDLRFLVNGVNARKFGSQGQQRTCALSLKLAELDFIKQETGEAAILLLDDVMSELDQSRRAFLTDSLKENQIFITMTEAEEDLIRAYGNPTVFQVKDGYINTI